jgi:hypothetical protein
MKFKEYLKETEESPVQKLVDNLNKKYGWIAITTHDNQHFYYDSGRALGDPDDDDDDENSPISMLFDETGHVTTSFKHPESITIFARGEGNVNMAEDFPGMIGADNFHIKSDTRKQFKFLTVKSFKNWIPAHKQLSINFGADPVTTLEGIEKQPCEELFIDIQDEQSLKCGVLRLMKCPNLRYININVIAPSYDNDSDASKINDIINKHLPNKDLADCMDELIEAGLKEYAKL